MNITSLLIGILVALAGGLMLGFWLGSMFRRPKQDGQQSSEAPTERKREQILLLSSQKMEAVGRLAGGVAHDFNNLLSTIMGHAELMMMSEAPDSQRYQDLETIQNAGKRGAALTRKLLLFSRKEVTDPQILDLNELLTEMNKLLRRMIGEYIDLQLAMASDLKTVKADPSLLEQVIFNLAVNAQEAMCTGGKVVISTRNVNLPQDAPKPSGYFHGKMDLAAGPYVMLSVADTGLGILPEALEHIFEPFYSTKDMVRGSGLGLSTAYGIITQANGTITVESTVQVGTTFRAYIPACEGQPTGAKSGSNQPAKATGGDETILIVEDEQATRELIRDMLGNAGYNVLEACHPDQAISLANTHEGTIHLLLTDVVMPQVSGPLIAEQIIKIHPEMRVLFMSGYRDETITHHGIWKTKPSQFLNKPFTSQKLLTTVRVLLDRSDRN